MKVDRAAFHLWEAERKLRSMGRANIGVDDLQDLTALAIGHVISALYSKMPELAAEREKIAALAGGVPDVLPIPGTGSDDER